MSYPNEMTKNVLDSLVKSYVDSITAYKQQEKLKPLDLRLAGSVSTVAFYQLVKGAPLPAQLEENKYTSEHTVITSNGIIPGSFDTKAYGMSPADPIREAFGCFWVLDPTLGPTYAKNQLYFNLTQDNASPTDASNYFNEGTSTQDDLKKIVGSYGYNSEYFPGLLHRTIPEYFKKGIEHFEFTEPLMYSPNQQFDFKAPILNIGYNQYLKIHYNFTKAQSVYATPDSTFSGYDFVPLLPLSIMAGLETKNEGIKIYYRKKQDGRNFKTSKEMFFMDSPSDTKWDSLFPYSNFLRSVDTPGERKENEDFLKSIMYRAFNAGVTGKGYAPDYYEDHSFSSKAAISNEVTKMFAGELVQNDAVADINPVYNFTSPFWEKATRNFKLFPGAGEQESINNELAIGNIYAYAFNKNKDEKIKFEFNKYGSQLLYCGLDVDSTEAVKYSNLYFMSPMSSFSKKIDDVKNQFPMYNEIDFKSEPMGELGIMLKESGMLLEFYETLLSYIYHANRPAPDLTADELNFIFASYDELEAVGVLNAGFFTSFEPNITNNRSIATKYKKPAALSSSPESYKIQNEPVGDYNFLRWLETYIQYLDAPNRNWNPSRSYSFITRHTKFFDTEGGSLAKTGMQDFTPKKIFALAKFMPKFQDFVQTKTRALHDIFSADKNPDKKAYSETIMYRIQKVDAETNTVLQNIFIPPDALQDTISYIDTQVKYGTAYQYSILATKIVIGTEYKYNAYTNNPNNPEPYASIAEGTKMPGKDMLYGESTQFFPEFISTGYPIFVSNNDAGDGSSQYNGLSVIEVKYRPSVRIIEVPYYSETEVAILDNPPMPPLANIYPLSGQKNKLLLTLENQTGERDMVPIPIQADDSYFFDVIRFFQKRFTRVKDGSLFDPTLRFKADDVALEYQIFKLVGKKPTSYGSFSNALMTTLSMENFQTGYEDTIATNTKYYYTFRTIDRHLNLSNPTPVYEVEMVEDSGVTYPIITIIEDFDIPKQHMDSKPFKRHLMIDAADQQIFLNEGLTGIDKDQTALTGIDPVLGTAEKSLWNNKLFKFRIKSKQTGKTIDLNLRFNTKNITDGNEDANLCD